MNSELVVVLRDEEKINELKKSVGDLFKKNTLFKGSEMIEKTHKLIDINFSRALIYLFLDIGIITSKRSAGDIRDYLFKGDLKKFDKYIKEQIEIARVLEVVEVRAKKKEEAKVEMLATFPNDKNYMQKFPEGIKSLYPSLRMLIISAKKSLTVVNPFFDPLATLNLAEDLANSAGRGVNVRIITRGSLVETPNEKQVESLKTIFEKFSKLNVNKRLEIRDYYRRNEETYRYIAAVHAKMLIADENACYLGSANITSHGLYSNFETGIILRGRGVKQYSEIVERLWNVSTPVKRENFS